MKSLTRALAVLLAVAVLSVACGSDSGTSDGDAVTSTSDGGTSENGTGDSVSTPESTIDQAETPDEIETATPGETLDGTDEEAEADMTEERIELLWVGPEQVDCVGVGPQKCLLIRRSEDGQVEYFYDAIEGFEHEPGTTYQLRVAVTDVENPPADASSLRYRLVGIVESSSVPATERLDGSAWTLRGFRDGDLFDPIADGIEITIRFDGDQASGSAGCNTFMGGFTIDGTTLSFGPLASTKKLCPPEVMAFEDRFLPALQLTQTADITFDGALVLAPESGATLVFGPAA